MAPAQEEKSLKRVLVDQIQARIETEIRAVASAVASAHSAATDSEAKPENKYDTRGLEASYLADAQRARLAELRDSLGRLSRMVLVTFEANDTVKVSALVAFMDEADEGSGRIGGSETSYVFLTDVGAGYVLGLNGQRVRTITAQSPLGRALMGSRVGDFVTVRLEGREKNLEILSLA